MYKNNIDKLLEIEKPIDPSDIHNVLIIIQTKQKYAMYESYKKLELHI